MQSKICTDRTRNNFRRTTSMHRQKSLLNKPHLKGKSNSYNITNTRKNQCYKAAYFSATDASTKLCIIGLPHLHEMHKLKV